MYQLNSLTIGGPVFTWNKGRLHMQGPCPGLIDKIFVSFERLHDGSKYEEQYAEMILTFPLFKGFTLQGARILLDYGEVKEYSQGDVLLKEGDN